MCLCVDADCHDGNYSSIYLSVTLLCYVKPGNLLLQYIATAGNEYLHNKGYRIYVDTDGLDYNNDSNMIVVIP